MKKLLTTNTKSAYSESIRPGWMFRTLQLAPDNVAHPKKSMCPYSTDGCRASCIFTAGHGKFESVMAVRIERTMLFWADRPRFLEQLGAELTLLDFEALDAGMRAAVRLNAFSDLRWEYLISMDRWPLIQFYDYTKDTDRYMEWLTTDSGTFLANYHLTYSASEHTTDDQIEEIVSNRGTVAIPFRVRKSDDLPKEYLGIQVIDGDADDARWMDPPGCIVGLRVKGLGHKDRSGFIRKVPS